MLSFHRRLSFVPFASFASFALAATLLLTTSAASALTVVPYSAAALAQAQKDGQPVVLHFHATWCPTCRAQDKAFEALKADPSLKVTLMQADYDTEKALEKKMDVKTQSTLVVFKGGAERSRSVGVTDEARLKAVLQSAL